MTHSSTLSSVGCRRKTRDASDSPSPLEASTTRPLTADHVVAGGAHQYVVTGGAVKDVRLGMFERVFNPEFGVHLGTIHIDDFVAWSGRCSAVP